MGYAGRYGTVCVPYRASNAVRNKQFPSPATARGDDVSNMTP